MRLGSFGRRSVNMAAVCLLALARLGFAVDDGTLTVRTTPEGIEVWLDDKYVGDAPIVDKKLKPGRYSLKLVDPVQHSSTVEEIFLQPGEATVIEKTIVAKFGSLTVTSDPPGAQVFISTELGKTPLSNDFMNPGKYRLELKYPGKRYIPTSEDVTIPKGKNVTLSKTLEKKKALDTKAIVRLLLGAGAIGGYTWAIVKQGDFRAAKRELSWQNSRPKTVPPNPAIQDAKDEQSSAATQRTLGLILGSACVIAFEIVAFF